MIAGFLLSFTFSLDDFVVASFVAGPTTTLPIYIFASVRRGVTPEINAIGTVVLRLADPADRRPAPPAPRRRPRVGMR